MYHEVTIRPATGGFGEFEANIYDVGDGWVDEYDLRSEMASNVDELIELGVDEAPEGVEDIRGRIRNAPDAIFAIRSDETWTYTGIVER